MIVRAPCSGLRAAILWTMRVPSDQIVVVLAESGCDKTRVQRVGGHPRTLQRRASS